MSSFRGLEGFLVLGGYILGSPLVDTPVANGATSVDLYGFPLQGLSVPGDSFVIAGNTYTITSPHQSAVGSRLTGVTFTPGAIGGFSEGASVIYATNTIAQTRNWTLTPSMDLLNTTSQGMTWEGRRSGLAKWTGSFEALLDLSDAEQAALVAHLTGVTPATATVALFFGVQAGQPRGFYGMALVSSDTMPSSIHGLVSLQIDFAGTDFVALGWPDAAPVCAPVPLALAAHLTACLDLEEASGTREDTVGDNDFLSLNGVSRRPTGRGGSAAHFVAASLQALRGAGGVAFDCQVPPFSLAFWVRPAVIAGTDPVWGQLLLSRAALPALGQYVWLVGLLPSGQLYVTFGAGFAGYIPFSTAILVLDTEYFVLISHDGATLSLQVNNGAVDSDTPAIVTFVTGGGTVVNMGALGAIGAEGGYCNFTGTLDSVMLFDVALTDQADRDLLWNNGQGVRCVCP